MGMSRIPFNHAMTVSLNDREPDRHLCIMNGIDPEDPEGKEKVSMCPRRHGGRDTTIRIL